MRIFLAVFLSTFIFAFSFTSAHAIYPFGGKIVALFFEEDCNDVVIVVVGPRPGIFELEASTVWFTLPYPPFIGAWTIGVAASPAPCSNVIMGGASAL